MNKRIHLSPDERREQIIEGALKTFSEKGFDATTNKEVAREAGIASTGLIYHYFKDKISLLRAVIEMQMERRLAGTFPERIMQMPLEEGLRQFLKIPLQEVGDARACQ